MVEYYPAGIERTFHPPTACKGEWCCIHNPSNHPMVEWPINIRETALAERLCPHGVGHPDPDSLVWITGVTAQESWGVHGCDGCCIGSDPFVVYWRSKNDE